MIPRTVVAGLSLAVVFLAAIAPAFAVEPHAGMLRYPDVSATRIVFIYANDVWLVPKEGGAATPLASPTGPERYPRFSPDGKTIAFVGNYDADSDLYTMPVSGGVPFRVTHHPAAEVPSDWTPDGRIIFSAWGMGTYPRTREMFTVSPTGGLAEKMPVPYGANGTVSPDGKWLAYTPHTRDHRSWKRYRGGMATDLWLFHLDKYTSKKITDWEGTDTLPMWHGDKIYYLSDAGPEHRLNLWVYNVDSGKRRQVTRFEDYDVKWPAIGPDDIVFQLGSEIYLLDLATEKAASVRITIPGDRPKVRPQSVDAGGVIFNREISSTGKRAAVGARGDIWTLPAKNGSPVRLTRTDGVAERDPRWSPDGQWIAYFSDETGAYDLYVTQSDGRGETRRQTDLEAGFLYDPTWSPDSKWIAFWDQTGALYLNDVEKKKTRKVDRSVSGGRARVSWSSDSRWIAYALEERLRKPDGIRLYDVEKDEKHVVTSGMFHDTWPTFDREGKYLYFASLREFSSPIYEDYGTTWVYSQTDRLYLIPLAEDTPSPFAPKSDEETWGEDDEAEKEDEDEEDEDDGEAEPEPVEIDLEGFEARAVALPVDRGDFTYLAVTDEGKLVYVRNPIRDRGEPSIHIFDPNEEKEDEREKTVLEGARGFALSADGKKLLVVTKEGTMAIVDAQPDQKMDAPVSTAGMAKEVDPRAEWRQIFHEAWRIQRDFFYDPHMHGVDWEAVRKRYEPMLEDCTSREDVSYVIREMIAELNVGHAYYWGGDLEEPPKTSVGMLGCDFERSKGAYRVSRIYEGGPWDIDARGPLSGPAVDVDEGDYLIAVNGVPLDPSKDPWAAFEGLAGKTVTLTVSDKPKMDDDARQVVVETLDLGGEMELRYRAWVERNRAYVAGKTDGRVGYIYVPNTSIYGQNELVRQFVGQTGSEALIIDERWNGGGQIPTRFVELLNRPIANYWATRHAEEDYPWPADAHFGPKCMLVNGLAGSGGDYFPFWFRAAGVGKLIGTRTWGGLVGLSGNPPLIDGGYTSAPTFAFFETDGTWGIEGHGVDPDIEVVDDPALMVGGKDPQLDAAIEHMLDELRRSPYRPPARPAYPDRSGMGIKPEDL